jgi:hypothetical protein
MIAPLNVSDSYADYRASVRLIAGEDDFGSTNRSRTWEVIVD